jgi:hypothetical protein
MRRVAFVRGRTGWQAAGMRTSILALLLVACGPIPGVPTSSTSGGTAGSELGSTSTEGTTGPGASGQIDGTGSSSGSTSTTGAEQCDINIEGRLDVVDGFTYSPCYTGETFTCGTCSEWCETAGLGACGHVVTSVDCVPPQPEFGIDACDEPLGETPPGASFRCACEGAMVDVCPGWAYGSHDWVFSQCCSVPFGSCLAWCSDHGWGGCALVETYGAVGCMSDPSVHETLCEVDLLTDLPDVGSARCICLNR